MNKDLGIKFTGWVFIAAAVMLWGGWMLLHHRSGQYFVPTDFEEINKSLWYWIWMYRIHIFGWVGMAAALFSLFSVASGKSYSSILTAGAGVLITGSFVIALATAFYYGMGAWGVGETALMSVNEKEAFIADLKPMNHFATCVMRFGRVFSGAGLLILGIVFVRWNLLNTVVNWFTAILGALILGVILLIPDCFEVYKPVFHIKVVWLLAMGGSILKSGLNLNEE